jgi:outer membrane protein assembly factor BamB
MNKQQDSAKSKGPRPISKVLLLITLLLVAAVVAANIFRNEIFEHLSMESGLVNILCLCMVVFLIIVWVFWLAVRSRWGLLASKLLPLVLILGLIGFFVIFRPVFVGDLGIARLENRFARAKYEKMNPTGAVVEFEAAAEFVDFPQFLGPGRNGVLDGPIIDSDWSANPPKLVWKKPIGKGWSGFAAALGIAFTMEQRNESEIVTGRSVETGDIIWVHSHERRHEHPLGGIGPRSTPTIDNGKVFALGGTGILTCLDAATGKLIWEKDIPAVVGIEMAEGADPFNGVKFQSEKSNLTWGRANSPLMVAGLVVVPGGGPPSAKPVTLVAFDAENGDEKWKGGELSIGYSSPVILTVDGVKQIVSVNENTVSGHDLANGELLWSHPRPGSSTADANASQPFQIDANRLLLSKGYGLGGELIRVEKDDAGKWSAEGLWQNRRVMQTKLTSAVVKGKYAYSISERILECVEVETGKRIWRGGKGARVGHGQLLMVGDYLLVLSERGDIILVEATPLGYTELARLKNAIGGVCWNTLCVYGKYLLIRSDSEAACYELPIKR